MKLRFGAMAPPLREQIPRELNLGEDVDHFQADADAITRLNVRGYISDSIARQIRYSLLDRINQAVGEAPF